MTDGIYKPSLLMEKLDFILLNSSAERISLSGELLCFQGSGQKTHF